MARHTVTTDPPPGWLHGLRVNRHYCDKCRRADLRLAVHRVGDRTLCRRHLAAETAAQWRTFRRRAGLAARGRLPEWVRERQLRWAEQTGQLAAMRAEERA